MKTKLILIMTIMCLTGLLFANPALFNAAEELRVAGNRQGAFDLLEDGLKSASGNREKAELYWRMGECYLNMGDDLEDAGGSSSDMLALYEQGEAYADMAIAADSRNHVAYYIKSANIGRWGQTKGIISSLFKAPDMKDALILAVNQEDGYADAWNVLAMLYAAVPGRPISFGNAGFAVSLSRKAYDSRVAEVRSGEEPYMGVGVMKELANNLWARDWSASKRRREQGKMENKFNSTRDSFEKNLYYEGTVTIPNKDDQEEAIDVLSELVDILKNKRDKTMDERNDLEELSTQLADWRS